MRRTRSADRLLAVDIEDAEARSARIAVIQLAVSLLGELALQQRPGAVLTPQDGAELHDALFACLEVLNNEKGDS